MTAVSLAELVGVRPAAITQWETGDTSPRQDTLELIARNLAVPLASFVRPLTPREQGVIFFRSMSAATKTARIRAERRLGWFQEIVGAIKEHLIFPPVNVPQPDLPSDPSAITNDDIEAAAGYCRREWGLGDYPLSDVLGVLEHAGVLAMRDYLDAETLDALSVWSSVDGCPYMVLGAEKQSAVRSRYDASHELGHLVLHRTVDGPVLRNTVEFKRLEQQAHRFAGAFLLPAASFPDDVLIIGLDALRALKPKWKTSVGAMLKRLEDLEVMSDDQSERMWINYARRGWRRSEPGDEDMAVEEPKLVATALSELRKDLDLPTLAAQFPVQPDEAARMVGVPEPVLTGAARISHFVPRTQGPGGSATRPGRADIVSIRDLARPDMRDDPGASDF